MIEEIRPVKSLIMSFHNDHYHSLIESALKESTRKPWGLDSQGIYVFAWKSVPRNRMEITFLGKIVNFLFFFHDNSACENMDIQHATT